MNALKKSGTSIKFKKLGEKGMYKIKIVELSDESRLNTIGKIGFISELLFGEFKQGSTFYS